MLSELTIPKEKSSEPALNRERLYALGLSHVQRLASRIWTDYNVHDPGITTLELLCYALTDLSYRASFPVKDLLANPADNAGEMKKQFFTARQILPNRPLTLLDYRKLLIDLQGVKNAWFQPAPLTYYADPVHGRLLKANPSLPGIKEVNLRGLYDVVIEYMDDLTSAAEQTKVLHAVKERLAANRSLCEDFVSVTKVETQDFLLCAELELASDADASKVAAEIFFQVQNYLAPSVANYALSEMLVRKRADGTRFTVDEIFDGPALDCGFIDDEELAKAELRTEVYLSDVISIIMDIERVLAVRDIVINPQDTKNPLENKWIVPVAAKKKALLNWERSRLVFYKRTMPVPADRTKVKNYLAELEEAARAKVETATAYDLDIPSGKYRQPGEYYSFQNHFPALYGLSEYGLSSAADDQRKAWAYQLKAYLLFFDQILANYFAQLSHVKELLSADPNLQRTYFHQVVNSFGDYERIYRCTFSKDDFVKLASLVGKLKNQTDRVSLFLWNKFATTLQKLLTDYTGADAQIETLKKALADALNGIIEDSATPVYDATRFAGIPLSEETQNLIEQKPKGALLVRLNRLLLNDAYPKEIARHDAEDESTFADRRNRFLDHLIARFAERFTDYVNIMHSAFGSSPESMIGFKCDFLKHCSVISCERLLAYNYTLKQDADLWNSENVSGLEKRLAKLLGILNFTRRNLGDIAYDIYAEVDATPGDEFRWRIRKKDTSEISLSSSTKYTTKALAKKEMQTAISFALLPSGYERKVAANGKHYFNIIDNTGQVVARRIEYFDTAERMGQAVNELMQYLQANYSDEGMYLIEMILLRPELNSDPFLPICPDLNCTDCAEEDPYSYRLHILLPAYSSRFSNMDFRRFVEEVIREETPAHILPRICWISRDDMAVVEKAYRDWIYLKAGAETAQRAVKLEAFIEILFAVRNVYPPQALHGCDSGEDQPKFLLGQTALGTMKDQA